MADSRRFADLRDGHAGQLTYRPRNPQDDIGDLHTARVTSGFPHIKPLGDVSELYPRSRSKDHEPTHAKLYTERNLQRRWLFHSHPEAFMATDGVPEQLSHELQHFKKLEETPSPRPLLAVGEIADARDPNRLTTLPVLACATGESGELLRLVGLHDNQWKWENDDGRILHIPTVDLEDLEDEAIWPSDGLPISQIKFVERIVEHDTSRYIIVQRETSTVVLQPYQRRMPVPEKESYYSMSRGASRIDPNPIVTLTHNQTGGNAHSDVVFVPGLFGAPRQLCVVDECGYWTLWNMTGVSAASRNSTRLELIRAGHIVEGSLDEIPPVPPYPAQRHGAVIVGARAEGATWLKPEVESRGETNTGQLLLVWNSEQWALFDLTTGERRPSITDWHIGKGKFGSILDVQPSPINTNHVFILTTKFVVWVDIFNYSEHTMKQRPVVLLTCAYRSTQGSETKMTVCRSCTDYVNDPQAMILLYNSADWRLNLFWFSQSPQNLPHFHRQTTCFPSLKGQGHRFSNECLHMQPLRLDTKITGSLATSEQRRLRFFQSFVLGEDFRVCKSLWYTTTDPTFAIDPPSTRLYWTQRKVYRHWIIKRRNLVRALGELFSVPDEMMDVRMEDIAKRHRVTEHVEEDTEAPTKKPRPVILKFDRITQALNEYLESDPHPESYTLPGLLVDSIQKTILNGVDIGRQPLVSWQDIVDAQPDDPNPPPDEFEIEDSLRELMDQPDHEAVVTYLGTRQADTHDALVSFSQLKHELFEIWLEPFRGALSERGFEKRKLWIAALAKDIFLSTHGAIVQNVPLFGQATDSVRGFQSFQAPPSSQMISSSQIPSSQPTRSDIPSSPPSSALTPAAAPDAAIQRLQLLAPSLKPGKLGALHAAPVLSHWPTETGVGTGDYVSSVAIATDKKFEGARERVKRIERKRKHIAEKYKLPPGFSSQKLATQQPDLPLRSEGPVIMSSQQPVPQSSQNQGLTMSQPASGVFGDRKKVKSKKKKSGFR